MSEKLMPCPFCGGERIAKHPLANMMVCAGCGVAGPDAVNREVASLAWNTRAQGAAPTGADRLLLALMAERELRIIGQQPETHWESLRDLRRAVYAETDAAILAAGAPSNAEGPKPDGWVLAPKEASEKMLAAGRTAVMAREMSGPNFGPADHYRLGGYSTEGIPVRLLEGKGKMSKAWGAELVWHAMLAAVPAPPSSSQEGG